MFFFFFWVRERKCGLVFLWERESGVFSPPQTRRGNKNQPKPKNDLPKPQNCLRQHRDRQTPKPSLSLSLSHHPPKSSLLCLFTRVLELNGTTSFCTFHNSREWYDVAYSLCYTCTFWRWWPLGFAYLYFSFFVWRQCEWNFVFDTWCIEAASDFRFCDARAVTSRPVTISLDRFV